MGARQISTVVVHKKNKLASASNAWLHDLLEECLGINLRCVHSIYGNLGLYLTMCKGCMFARNQDFRRATALQASWTEYGRVQIR